MAASAADIEELHAIRSRIATLVEYGAQLDSRVIAGASKFRRKLANELKFFDEILAPDGRPLSGHVSGNNYAHLSALLDLALGSPTATAIERKVCPMGDGAVVTVDLVETDKNTGRETWHKVTARNPNALHRVWAGEGSFGQKSVVDTAMLLTGAAIENPAGFAPPTVSFAFVEGVPDCMAKDLERRGVAVDGEIIHCSRSDCPALCEGSSEADEKSRALPSKAAQQRGFSGADSVVLDVSAMVAMISELTNTDQNCQEELSRCAFTSKALVAHAAAEREHPALRTLLPYLDEKQLLVPTTAMASFRTIVADIAGPRETARAHALIARTIEVPDDISARCIELRPSNSISPKSLPVFGTADKLEVPIVTANKGFVRGAANQGVVLSVHLHHGRALTETGKRNAPSL